MGFWKRLKEYLEKKNDNSTAPESNENIGSFQMNSNSDYSDTVMSEKNNDSVERETEHTQNSPSNTNISKENNDIKENNNTQTENSPSDNSIKTDNNNSNKDMPEKNNDKVEKENNKTQNNPDKTKEEDIPDWEKDIQETKDYIHTSGKYLKKVIYGLYDIKGDLEELKEKETDEKIRKDLDKLINIIELTAKLYDKSLTTLLLTTYRAINNELRYRMQNKKIERLENKLEKIDELENRLKKLEEKFKLLNNIQMNRFMDIENKLKILERGQKNIKSSISDLEWETDEIKRDTSALKIRTRGY